MVYCRGCKSLVRDEDQATLRKHGMCTPCYLHDLPPQDEQREIARRLDSRKAPQLAPRTVAVA